MPARIDNLNELQPNKPSTRIGDSLKQLSEETSDLPIGAVVLLSDGDEIYHVLYDINEKFQIPGEQYVSSGITYEKDGYVPKWRAIRDRHGRIMVAICHNMHLGDAWEHADEADYPEKFSGLAFRIVLNYITYSMTH